jgi:hypothetical protein
MWWFVVCLLVQLFVGFYPTFEAGISAEFMCSLV